MTRRPYNTLGRRILSILREGGRRKHNVLVGFAKSIGHSEDFFQRAIARPALPPEARAALRALALDASKAWRVLADECWRRHKAPMASYWRTWAVNARHLARICR